MLVGVDTRRGHGDYAAGKAGRVMVPSLGSRRSLPGPRGHQRRNRTTVKRRPVIRMVLSPSALTRWELHANTATGGDS